MFIGSYRLAGGLKRSSKIIVTLFAIVILAGFLISGDAELVPEVYQLTSPASSFLMANSCPVGDVTLFFFLNVEEPGTIFDTTGINAAQPGDWNIKVDSGGYLRFSLFMPEASTPFRDNSGWHRYRLNEPLSFNQDYWVHFEIEALNLLLLAADDAGGETHIYERVPTTLRSTPVYAGDFKGDEHWGSKYNIHQAAEGLVLAFYFGPYTEDPFIDETHSSVVIRGSGIDIGLGSSNEPGHDTGSTGRGTEDPVRDETNGPLQPGNGPKSSGARPEHSSVPDGYEPALSPEAAVRSFLQAQVDEDIDRAVAYVAMDMFPAENQAVAREILELVAERTQFSNLQYRTLATAYSYEKDYAIVRCTHSMTVQAGADTIAEPLGSLVLLRHSDRGWQVIQFIIDDLLNLELEVNRQIAASRPSGLVLAAAPPVLQKFDNKLVELSQVSSLLTEKLDQFYFDKTKLVLDEGAAWSSCIPVIGPFLSATYTGYQTIKTAITEVAPDLWAGDGEMAAIGVAQIIIGGVQVAAYVGEGVLAGTGTGVGVAVSHLSIVVDMYKADARQARNTSIMKAVIPCLDREAPTKYLFLHERPIHNDPLYGITTKEGTNVQIEYYEEVIPKPRPIKKITFKTDAAACMWKTMDFDVGYYFKIKESENQVLFDSARYAGFPVYSIDGTVFSDREVCVPVHLTTTGLYNSLQVGERFVNDFEFQDNPTKEVNIAVKSSGEAILTRGLIVGNIHTQRYVQFDINTTPGINQIIQLPLDQGDNPITQPVEIVNEIYNAVKALTPEQNIWLTEEEDRQRIEVPALMEQTIHFLGYTPGRPHPRLIGAQNVDWYIEDKTMVEAVEVGVFPDAAIKFKGLKPGNTVLKYQIPITTGPPDNPASQQVKKGTIDIEVTAADWTLVDVEIEVNDDFKGQSTIVDGNAYSKIDLGYNFPGKQEVIQEGIASWTSPPATIPDFGGSWQIQGFISHKAQLPSGGDKDLVSQYYSQLALTGQYQGDLPAKTWRADINTERVPIDENLDLDTYCFAEMENRQGIMYKTNRRIIYLKFVLPGGTANIRYIYEKPGTS